MSIKFGVVMDPIGSIHYKKDSTLAMLWEAQKREFEIYYFEQRDLFLRNNEPFGDARGLQLFHDENKWFEFKSPKKTIPLADLDVIFMRKDPPVDDTYIYTTYILEHAERRGVFVANRPQALRDANEKLFTTYFPNCIPETLVTSSIEKLTQFWHKESDIICKPLNAMGGTSVYRLKENDVNANVIFATLTKNGTQCIVAQRFISEITKGDKRILLIDGEPFSHALARIPQQGDWRGNLAVGAKGIAQPLSDRDRDICAQVGDTLRKRGLYFVGIDVIGDYLTEINVTSPTGIRELDDQLNENISATLMNCVEKYLKI